LQELEPEAEIFDVLQQRFLAEHAGKSGRSQLEQYQPS
jgi:hypothetical protein